MLMSLTAELSSLILVPLARSIAGWLTKSLEDGKLQPYEIRLLLITCIRIVLLAVMFWIGFAKIGVQTSLMASAIAAFFADIIIRAIKHKKIRRK